MLRKLIFVFSVFYTSTTFAVLPLSVNDQALPSLAPMIEQVTPAVVNISSTRVRQGPLVRDPFWGRIYRLPSQKSQSLGSGVIVDAAKGYILTNHHVIAEANEIMVHLNDGRELNAKLVGSDKASDVAVIQVPADKLVALKLFDSDKIRVGDFVVAIGNPFNLGQSVTSGIVSAVGRQGLGIEDFEDFIQTDAAINPGNSGGALVNLNGELVGINTAIIGPAGGNVGIGFAIPINLAHGLMQQLIKFGHVRRSLLGIKGDTLTPQLATAFDVKQHQGVVVTEVVSGSPADLAGVEIYDILLKVENRPLGSLAQLNNLVGLFPVGKKFSLLLLRNGEEKSLSVELKLLADESQQAEQYHPLLKGVMLKQHLESSGENDGILVTRVNKGSRGDYWGLEKDDVIVGVGRYRCRTIADFKELLLSNNQPTSKEPIQLRVWRNNRLLALSIR